MSKRPEPKWKEPARARIDSMSNQQLFTYLIEVSMEVADSYYGSGGSREEFQQVYAEKVLRMRLADIGFF